mgnify:CR=1 FL=1
MKAENKLHVVKLLFLAALATGCIAQAGPGAEDGVSSSDQALTGTANGAVAVTPQEKQAIPGTETRIDTKAGFTTSTVIHGENLESVDFANPTDPGGPVMDDGDGREPDPHPWHTRTDALAR